MTHSTTLTKRGDDAIDHVINELDKGNIAIFCGAGISRNAGIPLAIPLIENILNQFNCEQDDLESIIHNSTLKLPFETIIGTIEKHISLRSTNTYFLTEFAETFAQKPSNNHRVLAGLLDQKIITSLVTTNFDTCIEAAMCERGRTDFSPLRWSVQDPPLADIRSAQILIPFMEFMQNEAFSDHRFKLSGRSEFCKQWSSPRQIVENAAKMDINNKLVKLHGCMSHPISLGNTEEDLRYLKYALQPILSQIFLSAPTRLLFFGYSCSDALDIVEFFNANKHSGHLSPCIFWEHEAEGTNSKVTPAAMFEQCQDFVFLKGDFNNLVETLLSHFEIYHPKEIAQPQVFPKIDAANSTQVLKRLFTTAGDHIREIRYFMKDLECGFFRLQNIMRNLPHFESVTTDIAPQKDGWKLITDYHSAIDGLNQYWPDNRDNIDRHYYLGLCHENIGEWHDSIRFYMKCLNLHKETGLRGWLENRVISALCRVWNTVGESGKAIAILEQHITNEFRPWNKNRFNEIDYDITFITDIPVNKFCYETLFSVINYEMSGNSELSLPHTRICIALGDAWGHTTNFHRSFQFFDISIAALTHLLEQESIDAGRAYEYYGDALHRFGDRTNAEKKYCKSLGILTNLLTSHNDAIDQVKQKIEHLSTK